MKINTHAIRVRFAIVIGLGFLSAAVSTAQMDRAPAAPETDDEMAIEETADTLKINFPEMDLESVLKNFSALTGKSFILDQMPKGQIRTIGPIGPVEIPRDEAYNLFVLILNLNGYNVVPTSVTNVYKVVRSADAMRENIPIYPPGKRPVTSEEMVTRFIPLRYISATDMATQLGALTSKEGGQVMPYAPTNTLIILDTVLNIERMLKLIRILDVPSPEPEIEIVPLKYTLATEIAGTLGQIYQDKTSKAAAARTATTRPTSRGRGRREPAQPATPATPGSPEEGLPKFIPVDRINSLVIISTPDMMDSIMEFIEKLDIDVGTNAAIHVYYVQNAEASELASTLSGLSGSGRTSTSSPVANLPATTGRRLSATAAADTARAAAPSGPASSTTKISGVLSGDVSITSDEATNSLIIVASQQDYAILKDVIQKLDIPRRQVFVEAVLLEVTYTESGDYGSSIHAASSLSDNGVVFSGTSFSDVNSMTILGSLLASGGAVSLPSGVTLGALGRAVEIPGTDGEVVIPSAGLVLRLLATNSNVNVLSTPTLLTMDNEEASIEVGQKIPVPTGQTVSTGGLSSVSVTRESVGIKLRITPQINESDNIRMDISTEISGAVSSGLGIDVNTLGVTTSIKTAETTVIVKDAQTIVIGGLMEDRQEESSSRVPFLGDIPVIGWLFKSASQKSNKTNLIILLTPHIVVNEDEIRDMRDRIKKNYYDAILEEEGIEDRPDWDQYFEGSKLKADSNGTVIDMRSGTPEVMETPEDWEWTPPEVPEENQGDTAAGPELTPAPAERSSSTVEGAPAEEPGGGPP